MIADARFNAQCSSGAYSRYRCFCLTISVWYMTTSRWFLGFTLAAYAASPIGLGMWRCTMSYARVDRIHGIDGHTEIDALSNQLPQRVTDNPSTTSCRVRRSVPETMISWLTRS